MNERIIDAFEYYCENELSSFKCSAIFTNLHKIAKSLDLQIECNWGKEKSNKSNNMFLSVTICDENKNPFKAFDGFLTDATMLILVDRKGRANFFSWCDDIEFIENLKWMEKRLTMYSSGR